jgi:hypothetical protein
LVSISLKGGEFSLIGTDIGICNVPGHSTKKQIFLSLPYFRLINLR